MRRKVQQIAGGLRNIFEGGGVGYMVFDQKADFSSPSSYEELPAEPRTALMELFLYLLSAYCLKPKRPNCRLQR
jgi:hypothetical protein